MPIKPHPDYYKMQWAIQKLAQKDWSISEVCYLWTAALQLLASRDCSAARSAEECICSNHKGNRFRWTMSAKQAEDCSEGEHHTHRYANPNFNFACGIFLMRAGVRFDFKLSQFVQHRCHPQTFVQRHMEPFFFYCGEPFATSQVGPFSDRQPKKKG